MTYDKRLSICQQRKKLYDKYFRGRTAKSQTYNRSLITEEQSWMLPDSSVQRKTTNGPRIKIN